VHDEGIVFFASIDSLSLSFFLRKSLGRFALLTYEWKVTLHMSQALACSPHMIRVAKDVG
jgi:hypothetical protein